MFHNSHSSEDYRFDPTISIYTPTIRRRKRTNEFQHRALEELFARENQPNNVQRREIAQRIDMTEKQVQVRFLSFLFICFVSFLLRHLPPPWRLFRRSCLT